MALPIVPAIQTGLGVVQAISGLIGGGKARRKMARLQAQRKAYETPKEIIKIYQATQANASQGLGDATLQYLTGNADRALSSTIGAATLMGGDPNTLGGIFEQRLLSNEKIGMMNEAQKMENFSKVLAAMNTVAENKAAEQISRDNLIKDQMQAASAQGKDAMANVSGGLSTALAGGAAITQMGLFNEQQQNLMKLFEAMFGKNDAGTTASTTSGSGGTGGINPISLGQAVQTAMGIQNILNVGTLPGVNG